MGGHFVQKTIYNGFVVPVCYGLVRAAAPFHGKLGETVRGRRTIEERWKAARSRMDTQPVWFHVASVGEYEQARPLITLLNEERPDIPVAVTVTSPSGHAYISRKETLDDENNIRFVDYLPFDFANNARFCLATLDPRLLVFVKFDLWPNLIWEAAGRATPMVLIDATLSETSKRNTALGKRFYGALYSKLDKIVAISESDAERFRRCVPRHPHVVSVGDTRFDRVVERKRKRRDPKPRILTKDRLTVVAGSTWPKDETHLLGALARIARAEPRVLLVIAPHEPARERVEGLLSWANTEGLRALTLSDQAAAEGETQENVIVVDSVGLLAEIYEWGDIAYVGGSFSTGVHNVIEPAIMGIPVLFGPTHKNSFEAIELLRCGGAIEVTNTTDVFTALSALVSDPSKRKQMGENARGYVESHLGATERCFDAVREYL